MSQHHSPSFHVGSSGAGATAADRADATHPSGVRVTLLPGPLGGWWGGQPPAHREEHARGGAGPRTGDSPLPGAGSSWARVAATGRAAAPRPSGVHVALAVGRGRVGLWRAAARHTVRSVQWCSERSRACAPCPARDPRVRGRHPRPSCSSRPLAACTSGTRPGSGAPRGALGAPHGPPRCSATPARAEHVRTGTRGGALRGPETHPVTPRMLGARVVGVLGRPAGA